MSDTDDLPVAPQPELDLEALKISLHKEMLNFLDISESKLSLETFSNYIVLVELILELRGIKLSALTPNEIKLLLFFYTSCQLKKTGAIVDVGSAIIKYRKLHGVEIGYHLPKGGEQTGGSGPAKGMILDQVLLTNDVCANFDAMLSALSELSSGISTKNQCFGGTR